MQARRVVLLGMVGLLSACAETTTLSIRCVKAAGDDDRKERHSVELRIYRLKDEAKFRDSSVEGLWTDHKEALGTDLIGQSLAVTVVPLPADEPPIKVELGKLPNDLRFVGVFALFPKEAPRLVVARKDLGRVVRLVGRDLELEK